MDLSRTSSSSLPEPRANSARHLGGRHTPAASSSSYDGSSQAAPEAPQQVSRPVSHCFPPDRLTQLQSDGPVCKPPPFMQEPSARVGETGRMTARALSIRNHTHSMHMKHAGTCCRVTGGRTRERGIAGRARGTRKAKASGWPAALPGSSRPSAAWPRQPRRPPQPSRPK